MAKLDDLVAHHLEERLLVPERLEEILAAVLDRRQERSERRRHHIGELNKRATEADARLNRLYDAIENGVADLEDPDLKERIASLKATRDQAQVDAERAQAMLQGSGQTITKAMLARFARTARERMRIEGGGYRRDHLRALAQRVEVADAEVRIMGSKSNLLGTLVAAAGGKTVMPGVRSSVLKWRTGCPPNHRVPYDFMHAQEMPFNTIKTDVLCNSEFQHVSGQFAHSRSQSGTGSGAGKVRRRLGHGKASPQSVQREGSREAQEARTQFRRRWALPRD
jgi:hypothetical protein